MSQTLNITAGDEANNAVLNGIPSEVWAKFKERAAVQFPQHGELAWANFLSEVILASGGGDGENVSYFMTNVPVAYAQAVQNLLAQINMTWDQFHANFLRSANRERTVRLTNFRDSGHAGMFIAMGVDPLIFTNIETSTGKSFEQVMATVLVSAGAGSLTFGPETKWLEPKLDEQANSND